VSLIGADAFALGLGCLLMTVAPFAIATSYLVTRQLEAVIGSGRYDWWLRVACGRVIQTDMFTFRRGR
jgi:hypothetical protein